nr:uncharacterized protein LOC113708207 [Coffea arabica]
MAEREDLWAGLRKDKEASVPWFIVGDFNVITGEEEKKGGVPVRPWEGIELLSFMSMLNWHVEFVEDPLYVLAAKLCRVKKALKVHEDMFWNQKARAAWLKDGDKNTRFFHACVSEQRRKSVIHRIRSQCGEWLEEENDISKETEVVGKNVSVIHRIRSQCGEWLEEEDDISKETLAKRLARVLPFLISDSQSGFVQGRQLFDNFLLAQELVSGIRRLNRGGNWVLKLDMEKAYDRIKLSALCKPVEEGGVGIRSLQSVHDAFSMKLWWSFRQNVSLWARFIQGKYLRGGHPCEVEQVWGQSPIWRRMVMVKDLAEQHIRWVLGNGEVDYWHEIWIGSGLVYDKVEFFGVHSMASFVVQSRWSINLLQQWLPRVIVSEILLIPPPVSRRLDRMVWDLSSSSSFSVSSAYQVVSQPAPRSFFLANTWHSLIPAKLSFFMLCLLESRLPVMDVLYLFQVQGPSRCWCCKELGVESLDHIFYTGEIPSLVWQSFEEVDGGLDPAYMVRHVLAKWWLRITTKSTLKLIYRILPCLVCWHLWRARNSVLFEGKRVTTEVAKRDKRSRISKQKWSGSPFMIPKLNVNGCYRDNPGRAGGSGILRDPLVAFANAVDVAKSLQAGLKAVIERVRLCVQQGFADVHVESNSWLVV